ncbi:Hypothetical predicted protein [Marmota monax]|uniref:Uncharacterized protein n=1 Tax=Marmota monax TaxID=9995 RepID=A0A5E4BKI7_MARMO|nr:hypothetical protein GHT09_005326 [Marmota monax]VTJ69905.1 Hypothetical predicted protein [Marmota monax]
MEGKHPATIASAITAATAAMATTTATIAIATVDTDTKLLLQQPPSATDYTRYYYY